MDSPDKPTEGVEQTIAPQDDHLPGYSRVDHNTAFAIYALRKAKPELTRKEIAERIGVHPSTVTRWLQVLDQDTVPEARKVLKSHALQASLTVVDQLEHEDARVQQGAAKAIIAAAGVPEGSAQVSVGVQVIVGSLSQPAGPDPFESIDATVVKSES